MAARDDARLIILSKLPLETLDDASGQRCPNSGPLRLDVRNHRTRLGEKVDVAQEQNHWFVVPGDVHHCVQGLNHFIVGHTLGSNILT